MNGRFLCAFGRYLGLILRQYTGLQVGGVPADIWLW